MNYVIFLSGSGACSRVSQLAGGGGGSFPSTSRLPDIPSSPNHQENNGSSQRGKANEQWLFFPVPPFHPSCQPRGKDSAAVVLGPAGSAVGWIKDPRAPLPTPWGAPRALWHVEHPKNQSKWWGAASPYPWQGG